MWAKRLSNTILIFVILVCAIAMIAWWWYIHTQYDTLIASILNEIGRNDLKKIITEQYFTEHKYVFTQKVSYIVPLICIVLPIYLIWKKKSLQSIMANYILTLRRFCANIKNTWIAIDKRVKLMLWLLLLFVLIRGIYYSLHYEIIYDEAWNYNYFLNKNPLYSLIAYNNYPLHNIICGLFVKLFGNSLFVLRLASVLFSLLLSISIFFIVKNIYRNDWIALICSACMSMLPIFTFYSFLSRGVIIEVFFASIVTYYLYGIVKNNSASNHKLIFVGFINALGMMAMLSHLYFIFLSTLAFILVFIFQKTISIKTIILYNLYTILFSAFFFLPMILSTGFSLGINAAVAKGSSYLALHHLPFHCYSDLNGASIFSFYFLIAMNVYAFFIYRKSNALFIYVFAFILLVSPLFIKWISGIYPPERAMAFQMVGVVFIVAFLCKQLAIFFKHIYINFALFLALFVFLSIHSHTHPYITWSKKLDIEVKTVADILLNENANSLYSESIQFKYFIPGVVYYYSKQGKKIDIQTADIASTRYQKYRNESTKFVVSDTIYHHARALFISDQCKLFLLE